VLPWLDTRDPDFAANLDAFVARTRGEDSSVREDVTQIIESVRSDGDNALIDLTLKFDRLQLTPSIIGLPRSEWASYSESCDPTIRTALHKAADRIQIFHSLQKPEDIIHRDTQGLEMGLSWKPVNSVGLYVPGGRASYPSSVLMNAIPARIAKVERLAMCVPCPDGHINPLVVAAAELAGVDEIWRIGGAQAIAALAYGTKTIKAVNKIVGPGNAWVAEAKRQLTGQVGIDMIAGPSEIVVLAHSDIDPSWVAIDLLSQAEHDPLAQAILITDDPDYAQSVVAAIDSWLPKLATERVARQSWENHGAVILVEKEDQAISIINALAPEHLALMVPNARELLPRIANAGAIFLGRYTPEALGDYIAGPNHVLPTNRRSRFSSGLSVYDFVKRSTWVEAGREGLHNVGPDAQSLASNEGLPAHAQSIATRLSS